MKSDIQDLDTKHIEDLYTKYIENLHLRHIKRSLYILIFYISGG